MSERLYILDAHSLIYQVFHAIPEMTAPDGMPTNAVFGFVHDVLNLLREKRPDYLVCAFDAAERTFRHDMFPEYKGTRPAMPDDLRPQFPAIVRFLEGMRIPVLSQNGLEADDFLASVAVECRRRKIDAYLCTADKDCRQLVGDHVTLVDLRRHRLIDADYLLKDWGIRPDQVVDYQAMVGDGVDNVPGIPGVGAKTAAKLLQQFGTLEGIYEHVDEIAGPKLRANILQAKSTVRLSRELVRLKDDIPLPKEWSAWRVQTPDLPALEKLFAECGFHRLADELRKLIGGTSSKALPASDWQAEYVLVNDGTTFDKFLRELSSQERISVDLETTSLHPVEAAIVGYAFAWRPGRAHYVAVRTPPGQTALDPDLVLEQLRPILENPEIKKVGQNLKYDMIVLRASGVELRGLAFDSMVGSYLLEPGERIHNLDDLSRRLLDHETIKITELIGERSKDKPQKSMAEVEADRVAQYAGEDADVALRLCNILEPRVRKEGLGELFDELECPLVEVLAEMEYHGIRVDPERLRALSRDFAKRLEAIQNQAYTAAGRSFNLDSPAQLREILFEYLKLPVIKRNKSGPSTDQEVLEELADQHPLCALLLEHRRLAKLKGTYLDALPELICQKTGRIHASFNQTVAATGRLSSSDPNLQNIPVRSEDGRQIRQAFLPGTASQRLLSADYSQIELRLLAHYSGDPALQRAFAEDQDIHAAVAAGICHVEPAQVTAEMRRRAKAVNFGIMYGLSPFGLAKQLKIDKDEAAEFIDAYFARYAGIEAFFTTVLERAQRDGYVMTILGRRRPISGIKSTTGRARNLPERTAINTVIQGSAADLIKKAMLGLHRRLKSEMPAAHLLLQIHDELVFEVEAADVDRLAEIVNKEMTEAIPLAGVPLKVDIGVGNNWLDLEEIAGATVAR